MMKTLCTIVFSILSISPLLAQQKKPENQGTWVIESSVQHPENKIVKFYDADLKLIREDSVTRKNLNISRARVRAKLNNRLEELIRNKMITEKGLLANKP